MPWLTHGSSSIRQRLGLVHGSISTSLALGGSPPCCLRAPCHLGSQLNSGSHRREVDSMPCIPSAPPSPPSLEPLPVTQLQSDVASSQRVQAAWRSLPLKGKVFPDEAVSSQHRERMEERGACGGRVDGKSDSILPPSGPIPSMPCTSQSPARVPCLCCKPVLS